MTINNKVERGIFLLRFILCRRVEEEQTKQEKQRSKGNKGDEGEKERKEK